MKVSHVARIGSEPVCPRTDNLSELKRKILIVKSTRSFAEGLKSKAVAKSVKHRRLCTRVWE